MTETPIQPRHSARQELTLALLGSAAGAGLIFLAASQSWAQVTIPREPPLGALHVKGTGKAFEPLLTGVALVGLAGIVGIIAAKKWGRVIVGAVLAASGVAAVISAASHLAEPSRSDVTNLLADRRSVGIALDIAPTSEVHVIWPIVAVVGAILLVATGIYTMIRGRRWPGMSSRYSAPRKSGGESTAGTAQHERTGASRPATPTAMWNALDRGDDPTE